MSRMKVTDLEEFVLEQIMRPHWPTLMSETTLTDRTTHRLAASERYGRLVHTVDDVARLLDVGPLEWRMQVFGGLSRCGVYFPTYIEHKIVPVVMSGMAMADVNQNAGDSDLEDTVWRLGER